MNELKDGDAVVTVRVLRIRAENGEIVTIPENTLCIVLEADSEQRVLADNVMSITSACYVLPNNYHSPFFVSSHFLRLAFT